MAIFKSVQKKMEAANAVLEIAVVVFKNFNHIFTVFQTFISAITFVVKKLERILSFQIIQIIRNIRNVLAKVGRFAGPLKFITAVLKNVLAILQNVIRPFNKALKKLSTRLTIDNQRLSDLKKSNLYTTIIGKIHNILHKVGQINELAKLLEKQQEWIEKVFPAAFLNKINGFLDALTAPLKRMNDICKKIIKAIGAFIVKVAGYQLVVNEFEKNTETLKQWLATIEIVTNRLRWIISQLEIVIRKIPLLGYLVDILSVISSVIDAIIEVSGIRSFIEDMVKNNIITKILLNHLNKIFEAIKDLREDFEAILEDIANLAKDLFALNEILKHLHGALLQIAAFKWFLEFRFPNILEKMREALKKMQNPDFIPLTLSDSNSLAFIVESVAIKGKGIGNDWLLHFEIDQESYEINIDRTSNREIPLHLQILEETILKTQRNIQRSIHISATEFDPVYNDHGGMDKKEIIKLTNNPQEQELKLSFTVNASGGDSGAKATITVKLKIVLTENENVVLPLSGVGAANSGINYLEHALNDLRTDMGTLQFAPGLYANMNALDQFLQTSELLLNKLKVLVLEAPNDQEKKEQLIGEFYNLIEESEKQVVPQREQQFDEAYFVDLKNAIEVEEENTEVVASDIFQLTDDDCICDDYEPIDIFETETSSIPLALQNFDLDAYINSFIQDNSNDNLNE